MSYLAFDEPRISYLRSRMGAALDSLRRISCSDPEALAALSAVRGAIADIEQLWLPAVGRVDDSDVLSRVDPMQLSASDLAAAMIRELVADNGWSVIDLGDAPTTGRTDASATSSTPASVDVAEVMACAEALERGDIDDLIDDPEELDLLAGVLAAAAGDAALAAAFLDSFTRMDELCDALAARRVRLAFDRPRLDPTAIVGRIDAVYRGLAETRTSAYGPDNFPPIGGMEPYAAAQLMRWSRLDAAHAAVVGDAILVHATEGESALNWLDDKVPGDNTTDVVMAVIASTPGAASPFVLLAEEHPATMWWGANDIEVVHTVALQGLDPDTMDPRDAGAVLHAFISWFRDEMDPVSSFPGRTNPYDSRPFLGELAGPFLFLYSPLNTVWGTSVDALAARAHDMEYLVSDERALQSLLDRQDYIVAGIEVDGADVDQTVAELAALIGLIGGVVGDRRVRDAQDAAATWGLGWRTINTLVGLVPAGGGAAQQFVGVLRKGVARLPGILKSAGLAPPSGDAVRDEQSAWQKRVAVATSIALTQAYWERLVSSGHVSGEVGGPPSYDPSWKDPVTRYRIEFDEWSERLPAGVPPADDRTALDTIEREFVNAYMAGQDAAD